MNRRQYLMGVGTSIGTIPLVSYSSGVTGHITVDIIEISAPLEGGDLLDMTAELENSGSVDERVELDFIVGEDPEVVGERTVPVGAGETRTVDFCSSGRIRYASMIRSRSGSKPRPLSPSRWSMSPV